MLEIAAPEKEHISSEEIQLQQRRLKDRGVQILGTIFAPIEEQSKCDTAQAYGWNFRLFKNGSYQNFFNFSLDM